MWHMLKIIFCGMGIAVLSFNLKVVNENYSDWCLTKAEKII